MSELDIKHLFEMVLALINREHRPQNMRDETNYQQHVASIKSYLEQFKEGE